MLLVTGRASGMDAELLQSMLLLRRETVTPVVLQLSALGNGMTVAVMSGACTALLVLLHQLRAGMFLVVSTAGAILLNTALKPVVGRARPDEADWLTTAAALSFPSGHAVNAAATYLALALIVLSIGRQSAAMRAVAVLLLVIPLLVAASRVYLGVHYPLDAVAGIALGTAWTSVCARSLLAHGRVAMVDPRFRQR